jgi:hypothetical protein
MSRHFDHADIPPADDAHDYEREEAASLRREHAEDADDYRADVLWDAKFDAWANEQERRAEEQRKTRAEGVA